MIFKFSQYGSKFEKGKKNEKIWKNIKKKLAFGISQNYTQIFLLYIPIDIAKMVNFYRVVFEKNGKNRKTDENFPK